MATAYEMKQWTAAVVTPRQLEDAYRAAQAALDAYLGPEEVRPGLRLCCQGRLVRAVTLMGQQPRERWDTDEKWKKFTADLGRMESECNRREAAWKQADHTYQELCRRAHQPPKRYTQPACDCEGCRIAQANLAHLRGE